MKFINNRSKAFIMKLISLTYSQFEGTLQVWSIEGGFEFNQINLIVGSNAAGKTRALNVVNCLAGLLSGKITDLVSGTFKAVFENSNNQRAIYEIEIKDTKVLREKFTIGDNILLDRNRNKKTSTIIAEQGGGEGKPTTLNFQPPETEVSAFARRDAIQHPYFEELFGWASEVRHYAFGTTLGSDRLARFGKSFLEVDDSDPRQVTGIFAKGKKKYGKKFTESIIKDMAAVGYKLSSIDIKRPIVSFKNLPEDVVGIVVKENDLDGFTDQIEMSTGMFRALSVITQINYLSLARKTSVIIIDDIGEGLDFERSCKLINLLRTKAADSTFQLIMSTNDRFVMNNVPLEEWLIIRRVGNKVIFDNYQNSKKIFDDFKYTGLSNFDFFATSFGNDTVDPLLGGKSGKKKTPKKH